MSRAGRWWFVFGACNVVVALALIWTTRVVVDLERRELRARVETDYQQSLRLAMWRMDSWLAILFAREAARPSTDYLSPDLESDYIELRFEIDADGRVASAQETLDAYRGQLDPAAVHAAISAADSLVDTKLADPEQDPSQLVKTQNEFDARVACSVPRPPGENLAGRQVVVWLDPPASASEPALAFLRRTESDSGKLVQGSEMLADGLVTTEDQRRQYLLTLKDESQRLSAMVANVLTHARLEERGGSRRFESMNLNVLLTRLKPPLERRVESTPMALEVEIDGPVDTPLSVDAEAIGQILGNLVDNAAKYANGATSPTIHLAAAAGNGSLVLTVHDHGPGIPREQARTVFDPFERGGRDAADPVPGVGLGLALARGLARDMGGDLTLESPSDGGARFRLELPATAKT